MTKIAKSSGRGSKPGEHRGGRQKGTPNRKTAQAIAEARKEGILPLQYMLKVMRNDKADPGRRDEMAKSAAPYLHPKLSSIEHTGAAGEPLFGRPDREELIDRAIARMMHNGIPADQTLDAVRALIGEELAVEPAVEQKGDETLGSIH